MVTALVFYPLAKRSPNAPAEMVYPNDGGPLAAEPAGGRLADTPVA